MSEEPIHPKMKPRKLSARQSAQHNYLRAGALQRAPRKKANPNPYEVNIVTTSIIHSVEDALLGVRHYFGVVNPRGDGLALRKPLIKIYTTKED